MDKVFTIEFQGLTGIDAVNIEIDTAVNAQWQFTNMFPEFEILSTLETEETPTGNLIAQADIDGLI